MTDLVIVGGMVLDGTGAPAERADVRIRGTEVVEIGAGLEPSGHEQVIDANGAYVTPGFIDNHTHLDPAMFWDGTCDPMPLHGVTSVITGNCSLSLAPVRSEHRQALTDVFCYIEDMPTEAFDQAIPWNWETFPEYLAAQRQGSYSINAGNLMGHTALRLYVMGPDAWERAATRQEVDTMAGLLADAIGGGAMGMSSSLGFDTDRNKRPVPSRKADDAEYTALMKVLAEHDAVLQFIPGVGGKQIRGNVSRIADIAGRLGVRNTWIGVLHDEQQPTLAHELLDFAGELRDRGVPTFPQVSPRTMDIRVNWFGGMSWHGLADTWHAMVQSDGETKRRLLSDPTWREQARGEWDRVPWTLIPHKSPERIRLISVTEPEFEEWVGKSLADLAEDRDGHPSDVLADWVLANDLRAGIVGTGVANSDPVGVADTITHRAGIIGNSDAGAHVQMFSAAGDSTLLLSRHVRERGDLTIEEAVHKLTGAQAEFFSLSDGRGSVRVGGVADLAVFALDEIAWKADVMVPDMPAGGRRLRRPGGGYRAVIANGQVTVQDDTITDARPGVQLTNN